MGWIEPPERIDVRTRMPYRVSGSLVLVAAGGLGIGALLLGMGLGWPEVGALGGGPRWLLALFGAAALACGLLLALRGAHHAVLRARCAGGATPWQRDHPWPADGRLGGERPSAVVFDLIGLVAVALLLALLNGALLVAPPGWPRTIAWVILVPLDLLALGGLARLWRRSLRPAPRVEVRLARLPVAPGERVAGELRLDEGDGAVRVELRGIREEARWLRRGTSAPHIEARLFYRADVPARPLGQGRHAVEVDIPARAPGTRLAEPPVTYWELVVQTAGRESIVLLPVYAAQVVPVAPGP